MTRGVKRRSSYAKRNIRNGKGITNLSLLEAGTHSHKGAKLMIYIRKLQGRISLVPGKPEPRKLLRDRKQFYS